MKKAAGYIRVSTVGQAESGGGLAEQRDRIAEHCTAEGIDLVAVYEDAAVSGANGIEDREGLPLLLDALGDGDFDGVVIVALDRLARDLMVQETILVHLQRLGAEVVSLREPDLCSEDPSRVLVRQIVGAISQYEKAMIVARLAAGRRRKRATGGGFAGGFVPLGYAVAGEGTEARLSIDEAEAEAVRRIFGRYVAGDSMRVLAEDLEADDVPTKTGRGRWASATVGNILGNEVYTGATGAPAIIDQATFAAAQDRRAEGRRR